MDGMTLLHSVKATVLSGHVLTAAAAAAVLQESGHRACRMLLTFAFNPNPSVAA